MEVELHTPQRRPLTRETTGKADYKQPKRQAADQEVAPTEELSERRPLLLRGVVCAVLAVQVAWLLALTYGAHWTVQQLPL